MAILERGCEQLIGTLERRGKSYYVIPDDSRFGRAVTLTRGFKEAPRDKVVVKIDSWQEGHRLSWGHLVERIGHPGAPGTEQPSLTGATICPVNSHRGF